MYKPENGKVIFHTTYELSEGYVGANLFKLTVEDFDYSDFYAEIKFVKLGNMSRSTEESLRVSGTWHNVTGEYRLDLHQLEWSGDEMKDWIYCYIRDNSLYFFGSYPGQFCGYYWSILDLTSRSDRETETYNELNYGFIYRNDSRPDDVFSTLEAKIPKVAEVQEATETPAEITPEVVEVQEISETSEVQETAEIPPEAVNMKEKTELQEDGQ